MNKAVPLPRSVTVFSVCIAPIGLSAGVGLIMFVYWVVGQDPRPTQVSDANSVTVIARQLRVSGQCDQFRLEVLPGQLASANRPAYTFVGKWLQITAPRHCFAVIPASQDNITVHPAGQYAPLPTSGEVSLVLFDPGKTISVETGRLTVLVVPDKAALQKQLKALRLQLAE